MDGYRYIVVVSRFCFVLVSHGRFVLALGGTERRKKYREGSLKYTQFLFKETSIVTKNNF